MVHMVDSEKDGVYLQKSVPDKNVTYHQEQSSFILPVMTRPFNFKENRYGEISFHIYVIYTHLEIL